MPLTYKRDGVRHEMTPEQEAAFLAEQSAARAENAQVFWRAAMQASDRDMPRALEDLLDAMPQVVATLPEQTRAKLADKKALRAARPA